MKYFISNSYWKRKTRRELEQAKELTSLTELNDGWVFGESEDNYI